MVRNEIKAQKLHWFIGIVLFLINNPSPLGKLFHCKAQLNLGDVKSVSIFI